MDLLHWDEDRLILFRAELFEVLILHGWKIKKSRAHLKNGFVARPS